MKALPLDLPEAMRSAERTVEEQRARSLLSESDADRGNVDPYSQELQGARERALRALEATRRTPVGADWEEILLPAARQLLDALSSVADSDSLWQTVQDNTAQLQGRDVLNLQAILGQDLAALLVYMGYRPPPRPQVLELELKDALADALEARGDASLRVARRAQQHLAFFTLRLRRVITDAEEIHGSEVVSELLTGESHDNYRRRRLRAAVEKGAKVAVPAALAAGLVTLAFPPAGPAAAAGFAAAATAAGQEALKQGTQLAATGLLEKMTADDPALATVDDQRTMAGRRARTALLDLRAMLVKTARERQCAQDVDVYALESISALYGLLEAEARCPSGSRQALPAAVGGALNLLNRVRDVVRSASSWSEWSDLADLLPGVEEELARVVHVPLLGYAHLSGLSRGEWQ